MITRKTRLSLTFIFCALLIIVISPTIPTNASLPQLSVNRGLVISVNGSRPITRNQLLFIHDNLPNDKIYYSVDRAPSRGTLFNGSNPLSTGSYFTQSDIDAQRIRYQDNGGGSGSDSFDFSMSVTERISSSTNGEPANNKAECVSFSADGRYAVFYSDASNLVEGDRNGHTDVFLRDRLLDTTSLVSISSTGLQGNGDSQCASISLDGRYIIYHSKANNLVEGDTNGVQDIFLRNRLTGETTRVSYRANGSQLDQDAFYAYISNDGSYISFVTADRHVIGNDPTDQLDTFVVNTTNGAIVRATVPYTGIEPNSSSWGALSGDGNSVVILSYATNMVANDTNNYADIFVYDLKQHTMNRASVASNGTQGNNESLSPSISGNGRYVVWQSKATNFVPNDNNNYEDVFIRDMVNNTTSLVSISSSNQQGKDDSYEPSISDNGQYIAFMSTATNFDSHDTNIWPDVYVRDRIKQKTYLGAVLGDGTVSDSGSALPFISSDGRVIGFRSNSTNFAGEPLPLCGNDACSQIYIHDQSLTGTFAITVGNGAPTIAPIADKQILENTSTGAIPLILSDPDTPLNNLVVSTSSSNEILVPKQNITINGSGGNRTITVTPARTNVRINPNLVGRSIITVTVSDGSASSSASFIVAVVPPPWLVMLYIAADDANPPPDPRLASLDQAGRELLSRLDTMSYNPYMRLVVLFDGNQGNGAFGDSRVYVRDPQGLVDMTTYLDDPGSAWPAFPPTAEFNTGGPAMLRGFARWARETYPDSKYTFLANLDHGGGWAPFFDDAPSQPKNIGRIQSGGWRGMNLDMTNSTALSTRESGQALRDLGGFDVVFFDACLMGMLESAYEVRDATDYFIAGENLLFADYPYDDYLSTATLAATTTPEQLTKSIVARYNYRLGGENNPFTIAAFDMRKLRDTQPNNLAQRLNALAALILTELPASPVPTTNPLRAALKHAYDKAQKFDYDSSLTIDPTDGYVDLADFTTLLSRESGVSTAIKQAALSVTDGISGTNKLIIKERHVNGHFGGQFWMFDGANGVSIYLPLGEQDYRPSKVDVAGQPGKPERQLTYYLDSTQLALTRDAPNWSKLLERLEANTPIRTGQAIGQLQAFDGSRPFHSPAPVVAQHRLLLPISRK